MWVKQKLRKLNPKKNPPVKWREENGLYVIDNLNDEYYLKDKDGGIHYVLISGLKVSNDSLEVIYTSSSDLEARGLSKGLQEMVKKIYVDGVLVDV